MASTPENPEVTTMAEILETLEQIIPEEIRKRYCVGELWEHIVQHKEQDPNNMINGPTGSIILKKFLAAYLVNIIVQSLYQELAFDTKADPQNGELISPLSNEEKETIKETMLAIVEFVKNALGVTVRIDPKTNQPHVQIDDKSDPSYN